MERVIVKVGSKTLIIQVDCATTTVRQLKEVVQDREDLPADRQRMMSAHCALIDDDRPLAAYGLHHDSTVYLFLRHYPPAIFLDPPPSSPVAWPSTEEMDRFMKHEWTELVARGGEEGIHVLRPPCETDCSFLVVIEGPTGSLYEGGKFVVQCVASSPLVRVLTPVFHPAVTTNGQIAVLDGVGFSPWQGTSLSLLRVLRAQLLVTDIGREREAALDRDRLARLTQSKDWARELPERHLLAERRARVTKALVKLCGEVKALLLVTAKHALTGQPLHPEAGLVAFLPPELVGMVVHHLALAHIAQERTQLVGRHHQGAAPESEWLLPTEWKSPSAS